jgi:hypothetical protein
MMSICYYLEKNCLDCSSVFALFLVDHGIEEMSGRNPLVGQPLGPAHHPDEDVRNGMLRLVREKYEVSSSRESIL